MIDSDLKLAYFFALLHTLITGLSFLFTKTALKFASPIDVLAFRFSASIIALMIPVVLKRIHLDYAGKNLLQVCSLGFLYPIAFFFFQTVGLVYATIRRRNVSGSDLFYHDISWYYLKGKLQLIKRFPFCCRQASYIFIMKGAS